MIAEAMENFARLNGPWLQAWNDVNAASVASTRIAFGQLELATITSRFMTQRICAYSEYDGRIEPLVRRLDQLTEQYGENYARELRQIWSAWSDVLRQDRAATHAMTSPLRGDMLHETRDGRGDERARGDERFKSDDRGRGDERIKNDERVRADERGRSDDRERGEKRAERRPESSAH